MSITNPVARAAAFAAIASFGFASCARTAGTAAPAARPEMPPATEVSSPVLRGAPAVDDTHFVVSFTPVQPPGGSRESSIGFTATGRPIVFTIDGEWIQITGFPPAPDIVLGVDDSWLQVDGVFADGPTWVHVGHDDRRPEAQLFARWVEALRSSGVDGVAALRPGTILFDELIEAVHIVDDHLAVVDLVGTDVDVEVTVTPLEPGTTIEPPTDAMEIDEVRSGR